MASRYTGLSDMFERCIPIQNIDRRLDDRTLTRKEYLSEYYHRNMEHNVMKSSDIKQPKSKKIKGKKLDPMKVLKAAYKKPQKVAEVGGIGYV